MTDDWTDLDQAYLEIFGEHPTVERGPTFRRLRDREQTEQSPTLDPRE